MSTIKNDNLIDYINLLEGPDGTLYLMMEHASGDLQDVINAIVEKNVDFDQDKVKALFG